MIYLTTVEIPREKSFYNCRKEVLVQLPGMIKPSRVKLKTIRSPEV